MKKDEKNRSFTATFTLAVLQEIDQAAKETGLKKNNILVHAFADWSKRRRQARVAESYRQSPLGKRT